jgi:RTX calcium-binding nonapeptide repeat (4 copies)
MRRFVHCLTVVAALVAAPAAAHAAVAQQLVGSTFVKTDLTVDTSSAPVPVVATAARDLCEGHRRPDVMCGLGNGRRTRGGGEKASHIGWPAVTGILWIVRESTSGQSDGGTDFNDELLGSHGSDFVSGGAGSDILWGDQLPVGNNTWQHDTMDGGPGNDWIYSSHGTNTIRGGAGNDHIWGHFGRGTIDCGSGWDVVHVKRHSTYRLRNCERVLHH